MIRNKFFRVFHLQKELQQWGEAVVKHQIGEFDRGRGLEGVVKFQPVPHHLNSPELDLHLGQVSHETTPEDIRSGHRIEEVDSPGDRLDLGGLVLFVYYYLKKSKKK